MGVVPSDPAFYALLAAFLGFVFFCYLMLRRTVLSYNEGKRR